MKALIFVVILGSIIAFLVWRLRKSQAEEALARRKALQRRKHKDKKALDQDLEVIWPVLIRPVSGQRPPGEQEAEEPTMTAVEFEAPEPKVAQQGGSS